MSDIKPIETNYKGYRFRSRLEARWAVFFDACGIEYEYELEGYEREWTEDETYYYLPDFYLPKFNVHVEVKPTDEKLFEDSYKLGAMVDYAGPMNNGLLILGNIPDPTKMAFANIPIFSLLYNDKAVRLEPAAFFPNQWGDIILERGEDDILRNLFSYSFGPDEFCDGFDGIPESTTTLCKWSYNDIRSWVHPGASGFEKLKAAYKAARSARFEYGENGAAV